MKINRPQFLQKTNFRDQWVFASYAILLTCLFQFTVYDYVPWDFSRLTLAFLILGQFYFSAYFKIRVSRLPIRRVLQLLLIGINYFVFRQVVLVFSPLYIIQGRDFELILLGFYLLILLGRNIRMYESIKEQFKELEKWSMRRTLFMEPEKIRLHLGEAGEQLVHPNEILYVRIVASGDHSKIFGVKSGITGKFLEYKTSAYNNFAEIGRILMHFPQFKRINRSTIVNQFYPFQVRDGVVTIEGRRFSTIANFSR